MKKNTLIKLLCLALVCVLVLPMVVACGGGSAPKQWTVTLDPNGGEITEEEYADYGYVDGEKEFADEERIGRLPTPKRLGYRFLGWYDVEDTAMRDEITRKFEVDDDYDLVAHWEPEGKVITVEFNPSSGTLDKTNLNGKTYVEMLAGMKLGDVIDDLPTATREGYEFLGWKVGGTTGEACGITSIFNSNVTVYASWYEIPVCTATGTTIHAWGVWKDGDPATCTRPGQRYQACDDCGITKYMDNEGQPALGHKYPNGGAYEITVVNKDIVGIRTCTVCSEQEMHNYKQITYQSCDMPVVEGNWWAGGFTDANFIDGDLRPSKSTKGDGGVKVTLNVKNDATLGGKVYVDAVFVAGRGAANYELTITYADGTSEFLGNGTFGSSNESYGNLEIFEVGKEIRKLEFSILYPAQGTDFLGEIGFLVDQK